MSGSRLSFNHLLTAATISAALMAPRLPAGEADAPYSPLISPASDEGQQALKRIRAPEGFKVSLFAAEPLLANPVAFCVDPRGRFYVAETFRHHDGVTDIRGHMDWLDDDLACRTVADRVSLLRKHLKDEFETYAVHHDRVRLIEDRDGDGQAETATVFADGFHFAPDGIGAGLLARGDDVYFTCIPDLWRLRDTDGDGVANERQSLQHGYGVHVGFLGHDLHGLRMGPDGKLYFSIGDRGFHVETPDGPVSSPDTGAVLRCEPDGSQLEIFATGLRNPQELAFDEYGNLFTGDNNSDGGDQARWVHLIEGGDSGWRIGYQFMNSPVSRGPWNQEKMWHPQWDGQAAFLLPPLANLGNGPSGLCYHPGTGLTEKYQRHFFLCDFRGASGNSGVHAFTLQPKGATFEVAGAHEFVWSVAVTDVDFAPDGDLYLTDWVDGWNKPGKGRIYKVSATPETRDSRSAETQCLLSAGFSENPVQDLISQLAHADMRVRQEAQFALASNGAAVMAPLLQVAQKPSEPGADSTLPRLHAIWALGQIGRREPQALSGLTQLLSDADPEVRAQTARVLGDARRVEAGQQIAILLSDSSPRVRMFAGLALAKIGGEAALEPVLQMLRDNADQDPYVRHAGVMALVGICRRAGGADAVLAAATDASPAARMGVLLALRRLQDPRVAQFLADSEPKLIAEAARAINDAPIPDATAALAALARQPGLPEPAVRRALNANFRLGQPEHAAALAQFAARSDATDDLRVEALACLEDWQEPSGRDRLTGLWRPLAPRPAQVAADALRPALGGIFAGGDKVRQSAAGLAAKLGIKEVGPELMALAMAQEQPTAVRVEAIRALDLLNDARLSKVTEAALADKADHVRAEAQRVLSKRDAARALPLLRHSLDAGSLPERQGALASLAGMQNEAADQALIAWLDRLLDGKVPTELQLDLLTAATNRGGEAFVLRLAQYERSVPRNTPAERFSESLAGGDAERGRRIFFERADVSCQRCHKVQGQGGEVGPDLSKLTADATKTRLYLLEAIVDPNKQIAKGFDTVVVTTNDGRAFTGILKSEDATELRLQTPEGKLLTIRQDEIDERARGQSAMPDKLVGFLSKSDVRDLVEFLSSLK